LSVIAISDVVFLGDRRLLRLRSVALLVDFPSVFLLLFQLPPRSTLFPYTTLFRSRGRPGDAGARVRTGGHRAAVGRRDGAGAARSEEHTSELQSLAYLVCRLLLEKKTARPHKPGSAACIAYHPSRLYHRASSNYRS